jgi:hypothetical protein
LVWDELDRFQILDRTIFLAGIRLEYLSPVAGQHKPIRFISVDFFPAGDDHQYEEEVTKSKNKSDDQEGFQDKRQQESLGMLDPKAHAWPLQPQ